MLIGYVRVSIEEQNINFKSVNDGIELTKAGLTAVNKFGQKRA